MSTIENALQAAIAEVTEKHNEQAEKDLAAKIKTVKSEFEYDLLKVTFGDGDCNVIYAPRRYLVALLPAFDKLGVSARFAKPAALAQVKAEVQDRMLNGKLEIHEPGFFWQDLFSPSAGAGLPEDIAGLWGVYVVPENCDYLLNKVVAAACEMVIEKVKASFWDITLGDE